MSWSDRVRNFGVVSLAALALAACQPLHAGGGSGLSVSQPVAAAQPASPQLAAIDILPIDGRVGQQIRNGLLFAFTGGGEPITPARYRLDIAVQVINAQIPVVDPFTNRPEVQTAGVDAAWVLVAVGSGERLVTGNAISRATYTRNRQRFASVRAERDAEDRAAKVVVEQIRAKLLAHFSGSGGV